MSHTKEPWSYQASIPEEGYECFWIISRGRHISSFDGPQNDEQFSNVRRIVACVNACAGIPIDMLEAMPNGPASLLPMYARLEKQRDELLAACEKTISENGHLADGDVCTLIDFKRAIASVKANK